mmetsp:Transcript_41873/g.89349  ORF Transcript_41873/g.89349 Transcript_41873/m.89349 type:complete len:421 (+) Transcript_41873:94-1356(+)
MPTPRAKSSRYPSLVMQRAPSKSRVCSDWPTLRASMPQSMLPSRVDVRCEWIQKFVIVSSLCLGCGQPQPQPRPRPQPPQRQAACSAPMCVASRGAMLALPSQIPQLRRAFRARLSLDLSLDGDGLGEVARLVHVALAHVGDVVGEQLQRRHHEQRHEELLRARHLDDVLAAIVELLIVLLGDGDDRSAAREDLLNVRLELLVARVGARRDDDDGHELVDKSNRPVLHLGGRVSLGVYVRDLLELERALERHGEVKAATEVKEVRGVLEDTREVQDLVLLVKHLAQKVGNANHGLHFAAHLAIVHLPLLLGQLDRDEHEHDDLCGEGLRGGDADLGARVQVDARVGGAGDARAHRVADAQAEGAVLPREVDGGERVGRLAALRDGEHHVLLEEQRLAVAELGGVLDLHRHAREGLDQVLA